MTTDDRRIQEGWELLTLTELAAARFLCAGYDEPAVAARLGLPTTTTSGIIAQLYEKLGILSRVDLVIQAVRRPGRL